MVPTLKELKILLGATGIVFMPCLKKMERIGCLVQNVLDWILYCALWRGGWEEAFLWLMYHVTAPDVWAEHARRHLDLLFAPCCTWLVHHISNGKKSVFQIYFWNTIYNHLSSNWQSTAIIDRDKKTKKAHPTSWCGFFLLIDSLRIAPAIRPRVRKLGRALDWKGATYETLSTVPFYFKVWGSCGVLADCLLWKSLGYNRKT